MIRNQKGFTLIEIIAVLVILGILAAVAVPKYLDLQGDAKQKAAQGQLAEMKGTMNLAWGKALLAVGNNPTLANVKANAGFGESGTLGTSPDIWGYSIADGVNLVTISVLNRGTDGGYNASGIWNLPTP